MIDNRIYTFLELCNVMNYHKTAENLQMTQPAVTQHIQYFEQLYGCKLFDYRNKKLHKTAKCTQLEQSARAVLSLHLDAQQSLSATEKVPLNIGATKTIGEYMLNHALQNLLTHSDYSVNITIDNTQNLLDKLNHFELDVLMLEGFIDKEKYPHHSMQTQEMVGICARNHPFAFREVGLEEVLTQNAVLREDGSGTRAVFEQFLARHGHSIKRFAHRSIISSNALIATAVAQGNAISFVYDAIPKQHQDLATFRLTEGRITHEFNYVFLNERKANTLHALLATDKICL